MDFLIKTYAIIATMPFLSFLLIYFLFIIIGKSKDKAFDYSIHITSILFITAVSSQLKYIFNLGIGLWLSLLFVSAIVVVLSFLQWRIKNKLDLKKITLSTLKLSFYLFGFLYIIFFIIGFINN